MEIVDGKLGTVGDYDLFIKDGQLQFVLNAKVVSDGIKAGVSLSIDASVLLDLLAKAIPGTLDDAIIAVAKEAIKKL